MRVLLTVHQFLPNRSSGTEILVRDTGLEMLRRGHEVYVLTTDPDSHGESADVRGEDYDYEGLKVHALGLPSRRSMLDLYRSEYDNRLVAEYARRYVSLIKPDAVHMFHLSRLSGAIIDVFEALGVPVLFTPTDFWTICARVTLVKPTGEISSGPDEISSNCLECRGVERFLPKEELPETVGKQEFYRQLAERALAKTEGEHPNMALVRAMLGRTEFLRKRLNAVDMILAPTELMRRTLAANGIDPELITVSPYGIDTSNFQGAKRRRLGSDKLRIGYIGAINSNKGLDILLRAFKKLPGDCGATLRVCGDLGAFPDYAREVYSLAAGDPRVNFAGTFPNEKMGTELGKIDVLVVPSRWYENAPLVIHSALAAGIPVVATDFEGMAELVQHEENGLLFERNDPESLARQLSRFIEDPGLLEELGRNAGVVRSVKDSVTEILDLYARCESRRVMVSPGSDAVT